MACKETKKSATKSTKSEAVKPQQNPIVLIPAIIAGITFIRDTLPLLQDLFNRGDITKEDMAKVLEAKASLDANAGKFIGEEWEPSGR